jgi:hypothetical protein
MIERSTLIRAGAGRVRVLRVLCDGRSCWPLSYEVTPDQAWCRRYGCSAPHCCWANTKRTLCSRCAERIGR